MDLVGLQIWRGALLLADWILHNSSSFSPDSCILELGAGVGFTSIIAAMYAPVCCTDVNRGNILKLIDSNCKRNYKLTKHPITIKEIDFTRPTFSDEINDILKNVSTVIAADGILFQNHLTFIFKYFFTVIYDNDLTEHFIRTMERILCVPPTKTIFVAIEKRFVFTIADCDTVAPCYDFLIDCLELSKTIKFELLPLDFPQYFRYDRIKHLRLLKITAK